MDQIDQHAFNNKFSLEFLPTEMLFGIRTIDCKVMCEDKKYRPVRGIELGFIFFKITYAHMRWEN